MKTKLNFLPILFVFMLLGHSCQKPVKAKAIKIVPTLVETTVSSLSSGIVEAKMQSDLAFGIIGRIDKVDVKIGDKVIKGQILASLENTDLAAALDEASHEFERVKELIKEGIKEYKCVECGISNEWNGRQLKLQLDHINGDNRDHRKEII